LDRLIIFVDEKRATGKNGQNFSLSIHPIAECPPLFRIGMFFIFVVVLPPFDLDCTFESTSNMNFTAKEFKELAEVIRNQQTN
jgi:hypothetical protein